MPLSDRQKRWNNGNFSAYGYGWRLTDVDGVLRVGHTYEQATDWHKRHPAL